MNMTIDGIPENPLVTFEKDLHNMFDHIWDCEINHPVFQDTVGDLMEAVLECARRRFR